MNWSNCYASHQSLPLMREVAKIFDFCQRERTTPQSRCSRDSSPDKGSLVRYHIH